MSDIKIYIIFLSWVGHAQSVSVCQTIDSSVGLCSSFYNQLICGDWTPRRICHVTSVLSTYSGPKENYGSVGLLRFSLFGQDQRCVPCIMDEAVLRIGRNWRWLQTPEGVKAFCGGTSSDRTNDHTHALRHRLPSTRHDLQDEHSADWGDDLVRPVLLLLVSLFLIMKTWWRINIDAVF